MDSITIRPLIELSEFIQAIDVQKKAWNRDEYSLIPPTIFKSFSKNGGCVIGAFVRQDDSSERVIGYAIGFLAINKEKELYHHSQQVAVLPEYQQLGIASKLKFAQKEYIQETFGNRVMTWTVDPLLSKNAFLNYHKLGAIGRLYWVNYYGSREDDLNAGLETDRIEVEWWFEDPEKSLITKIREEIPENFTFIDYSVKGIYSDIILDGKQYIGVTIPRDLVILKEKNLELAQTLRNNFRKIALLLIERGYCIIDIKSKLEPKSLLVWTNRLQGIKKLK